jgi:hypothetical protein
VPITILWTFGQLWDAVLVQQISYVCNWFCFKWIGWAFY